VSFVVVLAEVEGRVVVVWAVGLRAFRAASQPSPASTAPFHGVTGWLLSHCIALDWIMACSNTVFSQKEAPVCTLCAVVHGVQVDDLGRADNSTQKWSAWLV
jgi:hypothetical protein